MSLQQQPILRQSAVCSTLNHPTGSNSMEGYCLLTHLVEDAAVCLYYKGMESSGGAPSALDVVVGFSPADALVMDRETAELLCILLNKDKNSLLAHGYTEFEIYHPADANGCRV